MTATAHPHAKARPLIVRLCNWVGEAVLALPALMKLQAEGYDLHLVGKRWATPLFAAHGWPVLTRHERHREAAYQLRTLRCKLAQQDPTFDQRPNTLLLTNSLSSAVEARWAGLRAIGNAKDGRSMLLAQALPLVPKEHLEHAAMNYWRLAHAFSDPALPLPPLPSSIGLLTHPDADRQALAVLAAHRVSLPYMVLCPFSGADDTVGKKKWGAFEELARHLRQAGTTVLLCPGPGEESQAAAGYAGCTVINGLDLGTYAAVLKFADHVVANDTGPGHVAAAVGSRLVSVFGPGSSADWSPLSPTAKLIYPATRWPTLQEVVASLPSIGEAYD